MVYRPLGLNLIISDSKRKGAIFTIISPPPPPRTNIRISGKGFDKRRGIKGKRVLMRRTFTERGGALFRRGENGGI